MRVLVVTTWLPTPSSPTTGIFVERDIDLLARDHDVHVVHLSSAESGGVVERSWTVETIPMRPTNPFAVHAAARFLRPIVGRFDLVHTMAPSALLPFGGLDPGLAWIHTEHWSGLLAPETVPLPARLAIPHTRRLLRRPDVVVAVSDRLAASIRMSRSGEVLVVPNAIEQTAVPAPRPRVSSNRIALVAVGGVIPRKRPEVAVRVVAVLAQRGRDVSLRWVGDGPQREAMESLAVDLGVSDRVVFAGAQPSHEVLRELAAADLFLLPTAGETFGVAIAEALASGRPVVVGADGGQSEFVTAPDGILVPGAAPEEYADAVEAVVALNEGRSAADISARVRARFTDDNRRARYAQAYAVAREQARLRGT